MNPKWETPQEYQARTGAQISLDKMVFALGSTACFPDWKRRTDWDLCKFRTFTQPERWALVIDAGHGKPPASWRIGDLK